MQLLGLTRVELEKYFEDIGEKKFRAHQLMKWIHKLGEMNFDKMTDLSLKVREILKKEFKNDLPVLENVLKSEDGTKKFLLRLHDGLLVETVFIPEGHRGTLCISTQIGCPIGCSFCVTGSSKFKRNLTVEEIISQLYLVIKNLSFDGTNKEHIITNVVVMGMGEPLLNLENLIKAINIMRDDFAYGFSKYRVTVSTVGLIPQMEILKKNTDTALTISLHAPNDEIRNRIIPQQVARYGVKQIIDACKNYFLSESDKRRLVTIAYVLIGEINDLPEHALELAKLLKNVKCKINLIPYNVCKRKNYKAPTDVIVRQFANILMDTGINTIVRKTRGTDIRAACGQLGGE